MIIFIYGDDTYRSRQKLAEIKLAHQKNNTDITEIEVSDFDFGKFSRQVLTQPLFSQSRLIIVNDILSLKNSKLHEKISKSLINIPVSTHIIFYESKNPDKRSKLFKFLSKSKNSFEFKKLAGFALQKWIKNEINKKLNKNSRKYSSAIVEIMLNCGNDLWKISNEIEKLSLYLNNIQKVGIEDLKKLVNSKKQDNVFAFIDSLAQRNTKQSFEYLYDLKASGQNELYILSMIIFEFRNLLMVKELAEKFHDQFKIVKETGINPYLARNVINFSQNFTFFELKNIYQILFDYDVKIKTGKVSASLALDLITQKITHKVV